MNINENLFLIMAMIALLLVWILNMVKGNKKKSDKPNYKKLKELKVSKKNDAHGVVFGKVGKKKVLYSPSQSEGSVGVFSASGTGKTSALGIPTLRSWTGTSLSIDISGDICKNCPDMQNKAVFEPENPETRCYSPFSVIDDMYLEELQEEALAQLAILLLPANPNMNENSKFFLMNGRKILTACLISGYFSGMDFCDICIKINGSDWKTCFDWIDEIGNETAVVYVNGFQGSNEANIAGCYQNAVDATSLFATNPRVRNCVRRPKIGKDASNAFIVPEDIEKDNIFLIVQDEKLELYAPLLNIIVNQFMQYISSRIVDENSPNILLFLDEYASLHIDSNMILEALRKYRKRRCRLMLMTQNLADLEILYGADVTRALLANMRFKCLLGGLGELRSMEEFAKMIGYKDTVKRSVSRGATKSVTESESREYIIEPADLDRLGDDMILISPEGYFRLKKNFYFKK